MSRADDPTSLEPLPEPGTDLIATLLADVLSSEAAQVEPTDRLTDIRTAAAQRRRGWAPVAVAAAAVVLIGGVTWAVIDQSDSGREGPAVASSPTLSPTSPATPSPTPATSTPSSSPTATSGIGTWAAPIYYLGRNVSGLFREFHPLPVTPGPPLSHISDAFTVALNPTSPTRPAADFSPWLTGTSRTFHLAMSGPETLVLTLPDTEQTARGATREQARLAAQQLVWTATAVAQDARLGLRIRFATGTGKLFGVLPVNQTFTRPPAALSYQDLSAIWLLQPPAGAKTGPNLVVSGQACTFEGNVAWQLLQGATVVKRGQLTTGGACPTRSPWSVTLRGLSPGSYTFRAFELSAMDGTSYEGLDETTFTVG